MDNELNSLLGSSELFSTSRTGSLPTNQSLKNASASGFSRRDFMKTAAGAGAAITFGSAGNLLFAQADQPATMATPVKQISMVKLPFAENALEPFISARTVNIHYNKHHMGYFTMLQGFVKAHPEFKNMTQEDLILQGKAGERFAEAIFLYSVLLNNHNWYWQSLGPKTGGAPIGLIGKMIDAQYGSYPAFRKTFIDEAMKLGTGWVWVVQDGAKVLVYRSEYQDAPLIKGYQPLLAVDVWEHAYYLDYQNERQKYVEAVLDNLLNWEHAEKNLAPKKK
jgi:Fe-Mn family superoxide dismutase